jgi:hypothetical protein
MKIYVAVTKESLPISLVVGPGDEHDSRRFREVMDGIRVKYGRGSLEPGPAKLLETQHTIREIQEHILGGGV